MPTKLKYCELQVDRSSVRIHRRKERDPWPGAEGGVSMEAMCRDALPDAWKDSKGGDWGN